MLAAVNRRVIPALAGEAVAVGRPAMRRLGRLVAGEAALALVVLGVVAAMTVTPPARHEQPTWPLTYRLTLDNLVAAPDVRGQVLVGSQVAILGLVALLAALALRRLRLPLLAGGVVVLVAGGAIAVPPLVSDAYPTTYRRPDVAYQAASIATGKALFGEHCAVCHGPRGAGDGPAAPTLQPRPPDLRAHHVTLHTAGDIFWWISHGRPPMPAFGDRLDADARWHLVNYLRVLSAADVSRLLGPSVLAEPLGIVAPDFTFTVGPEYARSLKDYRGQQDRAARALHAADLPRAPGGAGRGLRHPRRARGRDRRGADRRRPRGHPPAGRLAADPLPGRDGRGAARSSTPTDCSRRRPHAEFLIDRQGYLRAVVATRGEPRRDPNLLLNEVRTLNDETVTPPPPAEHVH